MNRAGALDHADGRYVLRFERRLAHPVAAVWRAITEPEGLAHWFPAVVEFEPRIGGAVRWIFEGMAGPDQPAPGYVTAYRPPHLLEYELPSARFSGPGMTDGPATLRFELRPEGEGCVLVFTNSFGDRPSAASFATGWHTCLDALDLLLTGRAVLPPPGPMALHEGYVEIFGLLAGTLTDAGEVRFERQLYRPLDAVWTALTGAAEPRTGEPAPERAAIPAVVAGPVCESERPRLLEYADGAGRVRWELLPGPGGARLVLTHRVPADRAGERAALLAGWHAWFEEFAEECRAGAPGDRAERLRGHYAALLGGVSRDRAAASG